MEGKQDTAPKGGYDFVRYRRSIPSRGPSGAVIFGSIFALSFYGFYKVYQGKRERMELHREKTWARIHLVPLLTAEEDRDLYRRQQASLAREAEIMKDVPGWKVGESVYNTKRYVQPTVYMP
ncbi:GRIM-19 [Neoconidiobolus thromboides FSU 785]|nr:GRIM-19 [Neoconidiobolus thromboides FSU 785]